MKEMLKHVLSTAVEAAFTLSTELPYNDGSKLFTLVRRINAAWTAFPHYYEGMGFKGEHLRNVLCDMLKALPREKQTYMMAIIRGTEDIAKELSTLLLFVAFNDITADDAVIENVKNSCDLFITELRLAINPPDYGPMHKPSVN